MRLNGAAFFAVAILLVAGWSSTGAKGGTAWDGCTARAGDIRFRAADGTRLAGHLFGRGTTAVVLAHQSDGNLCQWVPYAKHLATARYTVLAFDFRNAGDSQSRGYPANIRYGGDVAAAVSELRRRGAKNVLLVGASLGGSAVLQAATNVKPAVGGVVSVSGAADLSRAVESVPSLRVPVVYLAGSGDVDFANDARRLYAATREKQKTLDVLDDYRHGTSLVGGNSTARRLTEDFLAAHS